MDVDFVDCTVYVINHQVWLRSDRRRSGVLTYREVRLMAVLAGPHPIPALFDLNASATASDVSGFRFSVSAQCIRSIEGVSRPTDLPVDDHPVEN